ncbi:type II secretion system minor pseudopilin GspH [Hydrocarboniphaga sp.]|uniref:type II secretion system minor pseudopilin GspH n=1 Tax=Hydrocarboniphaga sp. TaxID=2033016 RepID=UPI00262301F2|nr:type II secretion system minor pseudopilin GspH [Hydrocarboniphaga sp.]
MAFDSGAKHHGTRVDREDGFTLIEIMVVMVIVGILASFVSLSIGNRTNDDRLQAESKRLQQLILFAAEQAQIQGVEIGLRTTTEGFEFLSMDNRGLWQPVDEGTLRPREIAAPFYLELTVEGQKVKPVEVNHAEERRQKEADDKKDDEKKDPGADSELHLDNDKPKNRPQPQIFLLSSGDASAFQLDLKLKNYASYYRLDCDVLSRCTLQRQQASK